MATFEHNSEKFGYIDLDDLKGVQDGLTKLGFDAGKADGKNGPNTEKAVRAFQAHVFVKVDGIVGPDTRAKLKEELDKQSSDTSASS